MDTAVVERLSVKEALRVLHLAWADQKLSEARWRDAVSDLRRHDNRVAEAEANYERACRG